jgi:cysteine desulfurase/selenocysteine lyase
MITYVNYAGLAPLRPAAYFKSLIAPELFGNMRLPQWFAQAERTREKVAAWLGCKAEQVAFVPSTSMALHIAAHSINWQPADVILYNRDDFPANVMPWEKLARFGANPTPIESWAEPWPNRTRMVGISSVNYATGIEQPWREVLIKAQERGIWTCVDAVQSAGIMPSWEPEIDFWCAGTHKWLVGGTGLAILVLSERALKQLQSPFPNWLNLKEHGNLDSGLVESARAWECGWISQASLIRLESNLDYFSRIGWQAITEKIKTRRNYLHERLLDMGWHVVSCPKRWSGIVSFDPGPGRAELIVKSGHQRKIITTQRGDYVRLSPHIFNSMDQLKKVSQWLSDCYTVL